MYDVVGDPRDLETDSRNTVPSLVFEWMDCNLEDVKSRSHRKSVVIQEALVDACLSGLAVLGRERLVHTGRASDLRMTSAS